MQPCNRIYYSTVYWRLNMFRAAYRSSSAALTVFAASGLPTHVVTCRSHVWVGIGQFPLRLDYGRSPHAYVNQRQQIQLELLMMSDITLETCWAFNPLKPELNPICYLLALLGAHYFLHVSRIRVKLLTLRWLMSYIYAAPILDVSRSHTTTQHSR